MDEEVAPLVAAEAPVPQSWGGYTWHLMKRFGKGTMAVIDYLGERIAYGLGITTPDWQYAIDIYEDMEREEREEREAEEKALREQQEAIAQKLREMEAARDTEQLQHSSQQS